MPSKMPDEARQDHAGQHPANGAHGRAPGTSRLISGCQSGPMALPIELMTPPRRSGIRVKQARQYCQAEKSVRKTERQPHGQPRRQAAHVGCHSALFNDFVIRHDDNQCGPQPIAALAALAADCKRNSEEGQHQKRGNIDNSLCSSARIGIDRRVFRWIALQCVEFRQFEFSLIFTPRTVKPGRTPSQAEYRSGANSVITADGIFPSLSRVGQRSSFS